MTRRRRLLVALAVGAAVPLVVVPPPASARPVSRAPLRQVVADGSAVAFAVRPTYDAGGASPFHLYIGYSESNASTPEPAADGQASWYNFGIAETAAFRPPENCTPEKNLEATQQGLDDVQSWISGYIATVATSLQGQQQPPPPTVPGPRHACTERLPGFAQSRFPATRTMPATASDNLLDKPTAAYACRQDPAAAQCNAYKQHWPSFRGATKFARDGSFVARSDRGPSQFSETLLMGAGDGAIVSVGLARTATSARVEGEALIEEATTTLNNVCVLAAADSCALQIDTIRQEARAETRAGRKPVVTARTVVLGVRGVRDITADDLKLGQAAVDLGGYMQIKAVSSTHNCDPGQPDPSTAVGDAGGLVLSGKGEQGGGIQIGGACVRARLTIETLEAVFVLPLLGTPGRTISIPGLPPAAQVLGEQFGRRFGPPRVITRDEVKVSLRSPIAWRTAPYWGSVLATLALASSLGYTFRKKPAVAPAARAVDRFARQFIRG